MTPRPAPDRALTVRQPWAWAILHAGKTIENRVWETSFRGPLVIHAGSRPAAGAGQVITAVTGHPVPPGISFGAIVGVVTLVDCRRDVDSPWAVPGVWHWILTDPRPLDEPIPCRGQQQLWRPPPEVLTRLARAG